MNAKSPLLDLPAEIQYNIIKRLDKPSKVCLLLTCPKMVHTFAKYLDLDRYRDNPLFQRKLGVPSTVSFQDPRTQGAIIRYVAIPGNDEIEGDSMPSPKLDEASLDLEDSHGPGSGWGFDEEEEGPLEPLDAESELATEEAKVQYILAWWLRERLGVEGSLIFCGECMKFMRASPGPSGGLPWCSKMLNRDL